MEGGYVPEFAQLTGYPWECGILDDAKRFELEKLEENKTMLRNLSSLDTLLNDVYEANRPTSEDYDMRRRLVIAFNHMAQEIYGGDDKCPVVKEFGSFVMDLFNASCDLDLSINFSDDKDNADRLVQMKTLKMFSNKLRKLQRKKIVSHVELILSARVPVLKVTDCGTRVECDLSVGNLDGVLKSQIIFLISAIDARFPKLCVLMKAWAKANDINSAKDGTINSYSLILLVAFHLQTREIPILPPFSAILKDGLDPAIVNENIQAFLNYGKKNKESLAELFVTMLIKLESVDPLWLSGLCVSTYEGSWILKNLGCVSIEDIANRSQNTCRALKSRKMGKIYNCICRSIEKIRLFTDQMLNATELEDLLFGANPEKITEAVSNPCKGKRKRQAEEVLSMCDEISGNPVKKIPRIIVVPLPSNTSPVRTSEPASVSGRGIDTSQEISTGVSNQVSEEITENPKKKRSNGSKVPSPPNASQIGSSKETSTSNSGISKSREIITGQTSGNRKKKVTPKKKRTGDVKVMAPRPTVIQVKQIDNSQKNLVGALASGSHIRPNNPVVPVHRAPNFMPHRPILAPRFPPSHPPRAPSFFPGHPPSAHPGYNPFHGSHPRPDNPAIPGHQALLALILLSGNPPAANSFQASFAGPNNPPIPGHGAPSFPRGHPSSTQSDYLHRVSPHYPVARGYFQHPATNSGALRPNGLMSPPPHPGLVRSHTPDLLFPSAQNSSFPGYQPHGRHGNRPPSHFHRF